MPALLLLLLLSQFSGIVGDENNKIHYDSMISLTQRKASLVLKDETPKCSEGDGIHIESIDLVGITDESYKGFKEVIKKKVKNICEMLTTCRNLKKRFEGNHSIDVHYVCLPLREDVNLLHNWKPGGLTRDAFGYHLVLHSDQQLTELTCKVNPSNDTSIMTFTLESINFTPGEWCSYLAIKNNGKTIMYNWSNQNTINGHSTFSGPTAIYLCVEIGDIGIIINGSSSVLTLTCTNSTQQKNTIQTSTVGHGIIWPNTTKVVDPTQEIHEDKNADVQSGVLIILGCLAGLITLLSTLLTVLLLKRNGRLNCHRSQTISSHQEHSSVYDAKNPDGYAYIDHDTSDMSPDFNDKHNANLIHAGLQVRNDDIMTERMDPIHEAEYSVLREPWERPTSPCDASGGCVVQYHSLESVTGEYCHLKRPGIGPVVLNNIYDG